MDAAHRATMDRLMTLSGPAFDHAYMTEMIRDHQGAAAVFMREAREGQDAQVRAWAMKTVPTIQEHQRLAYDIHSRTAQAPVPPAPAVVVAPAAAIAASPATVTVIATTPPLPPFCGGAFLPGVGTNFSSCPR